ncbi:helix-turn-helix domain-containing protein [Tessaracoccus sp. HDW20]|nr:helix-turn-helix domain-containing protein [Tessaracoccus coleopterorum]
MSTPHGLGPTRARVLAYLQAATEPRSVIDVANELDLHKNSARFHLDALVEAGFAERAINATGSQGRPPLVFTATSSAPTIGNLHLTELVQVLISSFIQPTADSISIARQAGHNWGRPSPRRRTRWIRTSARSRCISVNAASGRATRIPASPLRAARSAVPSPTSSCRWCARSTRASSTATWTPPDPS